MPGNEIRECQDLIFQWFWNWDNLVNDNNAENQANYNKFIEDNFDSEWKLTVHGGDKVKGNTWIDTHKKDADYLEFQRDMASGFVSSYSNISPLCFTEYKYDSLTGNELASFQGFAIGNMGVVNKKQGTNKLMQTHQRYNLTFIKRPGNNKWLLYEEESVVTVLDFSDSTT